MLRWRVLNMKKLGFEWEEIKFWIRRNEILNPKKLGFESEKIKFRSYKSKVLDVKRKKSISSGKKDFFFSKIKTQNF